MDSWASKDHVSAAAPTRPEGNEDTWGTEGDLAWVIDGATPLGSDAKIKPSPAYRFSQELSRELELRASGLGSIEDVERALQEAGPRARNAGPGAHSAIAVALRSPTSLDYFVLADCFIVIDGPEPTVITDQRMTPVNEEADAAVVAAVREDGLTLDDAFEAITPLLERQRKERLNKEVEGGYWVLNGDPGAVEQGVRGSVPLPDGARVLLCTDGFARLTVESGLYTWSELFARLEEVSLASLVNELRELEARDLDSGGFSRLSRFDDATALLLD